MTDFVKLDVTDNILRIRMDRTDKMNALTLDMYDKMADAMIAAEQNPDIRVIVIEGTDDVFCAGNDLQDFLRSPPTGPDSPVLKFLKALTEAEKPLVAIVNGTAIGIGVTMLLHCDFVYVDEHAKLSLPFVDLALVPEAASSMLLPHLAGHQKAAEILMLGKPFTAQEAKEIGMANDVGGYQDLHRMAMDVARALARKPPEALKLTKSLLKRDFESVADRIMVEAEVFKNRLASAEAQQIMSNFLRKGERPPEP